MARTTPYDAITSGAVATSAEHAGLQTLFGAAAQEKVRKEDMNAAMKAVKNCAVIKNVAKAGAGVAVCASGIGSLSHGLKKDEKGERNYAEAAWGGAKLAAGALLTKSGIKGLCR